MAQEGEHKIIIHRPRSLRVRTLNGILKDVAQHLRNERESLTRSLLGK